MKETFDSYYRRDYRSVVGLAYVLTGDQWAAEDLAQEAMVAAHRRWGAISGYDRPEAWVRRVMVNRSRSQFRKFRTEAKTLVKLRNERQEVLVPSEPNAELWEAVRALPTRQAQVTALYYWDGMSFAEIAEVLGVGADTARTHLMRARSRLAELLGDDALDEGSSQ